MLDDIGDAEALVAKNGSGINSVADLKGKKIAVPFNSTTHFHTMVALEQAKINPADVQILNMRPPEVRAAWARGDIQATFIWDPVLAEVKKDGKIITSSGQISAATGKATFDGYIANKDWAKANREFMVKFTKLLAASDANYRNNKAKWTAGSPEVKAVAKWSGAKPEDVPGSMSLYKFPTAQEQATKWLGGGKDSMAAQALAATGSPTPSSQTFHGHSACGPSAWYAQPVRPLRKFGSSVTSRSAMSERKPAIAASSSANHSSTTPSTPPSAPPTTWFCR